MIYIVRHGETIANTKKRYLGQTDSPLTQLGKAQHENVMRYFQAMDIQGVYSSPSIRCVKLAENINRDCKPIIEPLLAEMNFGIFEQLTWQEAAIKYPNQWDTWIKQDRFYKLPNGESANDVQERVRSIVDKYKIEGERHNIIIVTHDGIAKLLICYLLSLDISEQWRFKIRNGSIVHITISGGYAYMEL